MSNRHLSRTIAMQTLYEWDFNHRSQKLQDLIEQNVKQYASGIEDVSFIELLVRGVTKNLPAIDEKIVKYAPEWPIDKITIIDRNVLRLGIYELFFDKEVPPKVIINEAIEMAKTFGGSSSGKFVNGVLGAIFSDLEKEGGVPPAGGEQGDGIQEISVGGVVYRLEDGQPQFALIKDAINKWTFPKGKIGDNVKGEEIKTALARELEEEIGVKNIKILDELGSIDLVVNKPNQESYDKKVYYYLVITTDKDLKAEDSVTVKEVGWFGKDEILDKLGYENAKEIFNQALKKIK